MITNQMSFLLIEFNFCPREQRKSNCENNFHMFMLLSAEKLRNPHYYQIIQMKFFSLFYWHFLWVHALNQVYNSDKTFALNTGLWHGLFCCFEVTLWYFCVGTTHIYQTEGAEFRGIEFLRSYKQTSKTL